jgi:hypothetical protein
MMSGAMAPGARSRPVRVGDLLAGAVPGLRDRLLEDTIRDGWAAIAGADAARRSRPADLRAGVLTVTVDNSPWLHELTLRSGALLAAVRARHGGAVASLRFVVGEGGRATPAAPARQRAPVPAPLSAGEQRAVETLAAPVTDPELASALRRLISKDIIARRPRPARSSARREDS